MDNKPNERAKPGEPARQKAMASEPGSPGERLWSSIADKCNRFEDRRTRIAIVMSIVAALTFVAAYRAVHEKSLSAMCARQVAQVRMYRDAQRERYQRAAAEHLSWSDRYRDATLRSEPLLPGGRAGLRGGSAPLFDVETQLEDAVARIIRPVRDFTDPRLPAGADPQHGITARAEQDVRDLAIPTTCDVHDTFFAVTAAAPAATAGVTYKNALDQLDRDAKSLHLNDNGDTLAIAVFAVVLVLFILSEVLSNWTRRVWEAAAVLAVPASVLFAVTRSDEGMTLLLLVANSLIGFFLLVWVIVKLHVPRRPAEPQANPVVEARPLGVQIVAWCFSFFAPRTDTATAPSDTARLTPKPVALADVTRVIRHMETAIVVVVICLAFGAGVAAHVFSAHATAAHVKRTEILLVMLLPTIALIFAAWCSVNARERMRTEPVPSPKGKDVGHVFAYVTVALIVVGVLVLFAPWAAIMAERARPDWLGTIGWACAALVAVAAGMLVRIERWVRQRAPQFYAAGQPCGAKATFAAAAPDNAVQTPTHELYEGALHEAPGGLGESSATAFRLHTVYDRFSAFVVWLIAITALISAVVMCLYAREEGKANEFSDKAASEQTEFMHGTTQQATAAYRRIENLVELRDVDLRLVAAQQLASAKTARGSFANWDQEAGRLRARKEAIESRDATDPSEGRPKVMVGRVFGGDEGPDADPSFPANLFLRSTVPAAAERLALWDAYGDANIASELRADVLRAGATLLAIALYWFNQSLIIANGRRPQEAGYVLTGMGAMMLAGGVVLAVYSYQQSGPDVERTVTMPEPCRTGDGPPEPTIAYAAARCYARAELLTALARNPNDYQSAQKAYAAATQDDLRPGFTLPRYRAFQATSQFATTQRARRTSIVDGIALQEVLDQEREVVKRLQDQKRAIPVSLRETVGFDEYLRGIETDDAALLRSAVTDLSIAAHDEPQARFRLAVAELAAHHPDESEAYRSASEELLQTEELPQNEELGVAAINDLELLSTYCPPAWRERGAALEREPGKCQFQLKQIIGERKEAISRRLWQTDRSARFTISDAQIDAYAMPGGIAWALGIEPSVPPHLPLVVTVSTYDKTRNIWYVVPSASGPVRPSEVTRGEGSELIGFRSVLRLSGACLPSNVQYRIKLKLGGHDLPHVDPPARPLPSFGGVLLHEQGVAMCVPDGNRGWARTSVPSSSADPPAHLEASYRAADQRAGVDLFAFFSPRTPADRVREAFGRAVSDALQQRLPKGVDRRSLDATKERCLHEPGIGRSARVAYAFQDLKILTQTWTSDDGLLHLALVWRYDGSGTDAPESPARAVACRVLASLTPIDVDADTTTPGG